MTAIWTIPPSQYAPPAIYKGRKRLIPENVSALIVADWEHETAVCDAIAEGIAVPDDVLIEYGYTLATARKQVESQRGIRIEVAQ